MRRIRKLFIAIMTVFVVGAFSFTAYAATDSDTTVINATIASVISVTTSGTVTINVTPVEDGSQSSAVDTVEVATNNATGYALTMSSSDTDTALVDGSETIPAHSATQISPSALANNTWGYRVDDIGGFGSGPTTTPLDNEPSSAQTFAGVPSSSAPNTIATTATTTSGDETEIWYSMKADATKPAGTYSDTVTYTATTNP